MPVPYSDNLYSMSDDDADVDAGAGAADAQQDVDALSPADGYFHGSSSDPASSPHGLADESPRRVPQHLHHAGVPSVPNVMVEDPTLRDQDASAKAREAEEERRLLNSQAASSPAAAQPRQSAPHQDPSLPTQHHRRAVDDDYAPAPAHASSSSSAAAPAPHTLPAPAPPSDAPPAYSPRSPTSPTSPHASVSGYQTFGNAPQSPGMGAAEEQQSLLQREPQSMGAPGGHPGGSLWQRFKGRMPARGAARAKIRRILGVLLVISIVAAILGSVSAPSTSRNHRDGHVPDPIDKDPIKKPEAPPQGGMKWYSGQQCGSGPTRSARLQWPLKTGTAHNLTIVQDLDNDNVPPGDSWNPHVSGEVILRPAGDSESSVHFEVLFNFEGSGIEFDWDYDDQILNMRTPRAIPQEGLGPGLRPCIQARITAFVPEDAWLRYLEVSVVHLDINLAQGLDLSLEHLASLTTVAGDIRAPSKPSSGEKLPYKLASRETWLQAVSGDVVGWFPMYDLLLIHTVSGDVLVDVGPKPAQGKHPKPAVLEIATVSGDVAVREPIGAKEAEGALPPRDYVVHVKTTSGDVKADLAVGPEATFESHSGDVLLSLLPLLQKHPSSSSSSSSSLSSLSSPPSSSGEADTAAPAPTPEKQELSTSTNSGLTVVKLLDPRWDDLPRSSETRNLSAMNSAHKSMSGDIRLHYPAAWAGSFEAQTLSGDQRFRGEGLHTERAGRRFPRLVTGFKEGGDSFLRVKSVSGDEDFLVGEE